MNEEELYNHIVDMLSNGKFLQLNGKPIDLSELNNYPNAQQEEIERLKEQLNDEIQEELKQSEIMVKKQQEIERLNNIINKLEEDKKKLKECLGIVSPSRELIEGKYWEKEKDNE